MIICGSVEIGENLLDWAKLIRNGISIGKNCVIGMGAVVTKTSQAIKPGLETLQEKQQLKTIVWSKECAVSSLTLNEQEKVDPRDVELMLSKIKHRGPDSNGIFCHENLGLGSQRLRIHDLSNSSDLTYEKPMWTLHHSF